MRKRICRVTNNAVVRTTCSRLPLETLRSSNLVDVTLTGTRDAPGPLVDRIYTTGAHLTARHGGWHAHLRPTRAAVKQVSD